MNFLNRHNCEILSGIKLSKISLSEHEIPRRMFKYGGEYIGEIYDDVNGEYVWAVLTKWKGVYHISGYYQDLKVLEQSL